MNPRKTRINFEVVLAISLDFKSWWKTENLREMWSSSASWTTTCLPNSFRLILFVWGVTIIMDLLPSFVVINVSKGGTIGHSNSHQAASIQSNLCIPFILPCTFYSLHFGSCPSLVVSDFKLLWILLLLFQVCLSLVHFRFQMWASLFWYTTAFG